MACDRVLKSLIIYSENVGEAGNGEGISSI